MIEQKLFGIIYRATNVINGKCYIGQTVHSLAKRISGHLNISNCGAETAFHKAIRKYDIDSFKWEVLCECLSREELNAQEIFFIKKYNAYGNGGYNMSYGGESNDGWVPSDTTIENFKKASKKRWAKKSEREKTSCAVKKLYKDNPKLREYINNKIRKITQSEEYKKKKSEEARKRWQKEDYRNKRLKLAQNKGYRKRLSSSIKKSWANDDERRKNTSILMKKLRKKDIDVIKEKVSKRWVVNGIIIKNLMDWCQKNNIKYHSFYCYKDKDKSYKGYFLRSMEK